MNNWDKYFAYDKSTGCLIRKNGKYAGVVRGSMCKRGYRRIKVNGKLVQEHRIVWEVSNGPIPDGMQIDHINGNRSDNRLQNLRLATNAQNQYNARVRCNSNSRIKGVFWNKQKSKWASQIRAGSAREFLGYFDTKGLAAVAYAKAAIRLHGKFARFA